VTEQVRFTGRISDAELQSYFAACDLFALPSTGEGFGIVYLEAMYHAKACVAARAGGAPEVVEDGVTGLLVEPEGLSQLSSVLISLLQDDGRRTAMGQAGRIRLEREFSGESFRRRLEELCQSRR
jgi:glycosyltransferase involved in cell wall biosynthesis